MTARLKLVSAIGAFVFGAFFMQANAQGTTVGSSPWYSTGYLNYMMGTVNLTGSNTQNVVPVPTNTTPVQVPVVVPVVVKNCPAYITSFHKYGDKGVDVAKLQMFLNEFNGAKLNGKGVFGPATMREVKNFQYNYGVKVTGAQYEKTTALINALNCGNIAKKDRKVFTGSMATVYSNPGITTIKSGTISNIYPNPTPVNVVKEYPTKTVIKSPMVGSPSGATLTATTTNSFFTNLSNDWDKIKENYKAYVLVFLLVLALFWFLRKAATE